MIPISEDQEIYPTEYTFLEGGVFGRWKFGPVTKKELASLVGKAYSRFDSVVPLGSEGKHVHCLIFESAAAGIGNYARWDCINGWTTTLEEAKKRFPSGLHGKKQY